MSPYLALWMLPVVLGLALAIFLAALTGQRRAGEALRRLGLLRIPEEAAPPRVLARALELSRAAEAQAIEDPVTSLLNDPVLLAAHLHMLPPARRKRIDPIDPALLMGREKLGEAVSREDGWAVLTRPERLAVLADEACLERLVALI